MVFGFFKKKKPVQQPTPNPQQNVQKSPSPSKSKESPQKNTPAHDSRANLTEEEQWMYDTVVQFLMSPTWRIPILTFIDDNCIVFDDEEENKFEYTDIHKQFKKLIEGLVEDMLAELEIEEEKLANILQAGIQDREYRKIFEQLLVTDNFLVFKALMVKRNKELELEALQQLNELEQSRTNYAPPSHMNPEKHAQDIERATAEKEQAEINHAIALSLAVEQERTKLMEQEDYELREALRLSQAEYSKEQFALKREAEKKRQELEALKNKEKQELEAMKNKEKQELEAMKSKEKEAEKQRELEKEKEHEREKQKQLESDKEKQRLQAEKEKAKEQELAKLQKIKADAEAQKKLQESQQQAQSHMAQSTSTTASTVLEESKVSEKVGGEFNGKKLDPIRQSTKNLPPLMEESKINPNSLPPIKGSANYNPNQELEEVDTSNAKNEGAGKAETMDERKARLKAQRDLILAKKKAEREAELNNYEAQKGKNAKSTQKTEELTKEEVEKRKEVYSKLKGEL